MSSSTSCWMHAASFLQAGNAGVDAVPQQLRVDAVRVRVGLPAVQVLDVVGVTQRQGLQPQQCHVSHALAWLQQQ